MKIIAKTCVFESIVVKIIAKTSVFESIVVKIIAKTCVCLSIVVKLIAKTCVCWTIVINCCENHGLEEVWWYAAKGLVSGAILYNVQALSRYGRSSFPQEGLL